MTSTTWPYGLERTAVPTTRPQLPLPRALRRSDIAHRDEQRVRPSHVAAWCVGGSIGWAALIATGWLAVDVLGHLVR